MEIHEIRKPHNPAALAFNDLQSQSINCWDYIVCCHWLLLVTIENAKQSVVKWKLLALSHRNWVVVDRNDKYLTSVDKPVLAQVVPHFEDGKLCLNAPSMDTLRIPIQLDTKEFKDLKY